MKTIVGLIAMVTIVLGTMVGCGTTPSDAGYRHVSVGPMTVSVPDDWQRPEDYEEAVDEIFTGFTEEDRQVIQMDVYEDESGDAFVLMMTYDMIGVFELDGLTWRGWDIELEEAGRTTEEFAELIEMSVMVGFTELVQEVHQQLTVGGLDAWETTYTANSEGEPMQACLLVVFAPDDAGTLLMVVEQAEWERFEGTWEKIRDSVRF